MPDPATAVTEPLQVLDTPLGVPTTSPEGRLSMNVIVVRLPGLAAGFEIVNVTVVVPPTAMEEAPNALLITGAVNTLRVAVLLVAPVPPSVDVIAPVVLAFAPALVPITCTVTVQEPPAAIVPPLNVSVVSPGLGANVPPQVVLAPVGESTCNPEGSTSVNDTPVRAVPELGLLIVNVNIEKVPLIKMLPGLNALLIVGGATTVRVAVLLATPVPPSFDCGAFVVLFFAPAVVPVTFTLRVQDVPGASVPPPKFSVVSPGVAFHVPVHVVRGLAGFATCNPAGKLSEKLTPVNVTPVFGFVRVNVSTVEPFSGIDDAPNALLTVGGCTTVSVAVSVGTATLHASVASTV